MCVCVCVCVCVCAGQVSGSACLFLMLPFAEAGQGGVMFEIRGGKGDVISTSVS